MSYTAMYRRFRPTTFEEVKGQDAIVTTLKTRSGRIVSVMPIYSAVQEVPVKRVLRSFLQKVSIASIPWTEAPAENAHPVRRLQKAEA